VIHFPESLDGFNEADVREEIIAPFLHYLGYRARSSANIIREQPLRYPKESLGRKNPRRDPPLRGRADYILEVDGLVRWTIEAKAPTSSITADDVEQAYSYARHPEVRAVLFAVINGAELRIYQTDHSPDSPPVLALSYGDFPDAIQQLENLLGPEAMRRDFPRVALDPGRPIGPRLRSVVRLVSGHVEFQRSNPALPLLDQVTLFVTDGSIERDENGKLVLFIGLLSPFRSANRFNERLGLRHLELGSPDSSLSTDPNSQTVFRQQMVVTLPAGETLPSLTGEGDMVLPQNLTCRSVTVANGILVGNRFLGQFVQGYEYSGLPGDHDQLVVEASGQFETVLA